MNFTNTRLGSVVGRSVAAVLVDIISWRPEIVLAGGLEGA